MIWPRVARHTVDTEILQMGSEVLQSCSNARVGLYNHGF